MSKPRVIDGADRRKMRFLEMLAFIENNGGASTREIQAFMLTRYGLRYSTTTEYIKEAHLARLIAGDGAVWQTTRTYKQLTRILYG